MYSTHGSLDSIFFNTNTGLKTGNDLLLGQTDYIGLNTISNGLQENTILVSYIACNTAGTDGIASNSSLTYNTVTNGANIALGFKKEISYSRAAEPWAERYNERLAQGYGVEDAAEYASQFMYLDSSIYSWHLVYNSSVASTNMKIGNYYSANDLGGTANYTRNLIKNEEQLSKISTQKDIVNQLKNIDETFNEDNYEITSEISTIYDINGYDSREIEYVVARLKIGNFNTNAGYVARIENNTITAIYDNNINLTLQEDALKNKSQFNMTVDKNTLNNLKNKAIIIGEERYTNTKISVKEEEIEYFYDIEENKKYIVVPIISTGYDEEKLIDLIMYQI